jgi:hypothetical protein
VPEVSQREAVQKARANYELEVAARAKRAADPQ